MRAELRVTFGGNAVEFDEIEVMRDTRLDRRISGERAREFVTIER